MTPSRPYLLNALYEWILDNNFTPYIAVNALYEGTLVPKEFVQGGQIILDINPNAVHKFAMGKEDLQFQGRFSGVSRQIYIPMPAITAIYAKETGAGMVFPANEYDDVVRGPVAVPESAEGESGAGSAGQGSGSSSDPSGGGKPRGKKSNLRIVK